MLDAVVVGAGPVGLYLAVAAQRRGLDVAVLEARPALGDLEDDRSLALSWGSWLLLERAGVTAALAGAATAIARIHVSQAGAFGRTELTAADAAVPALGYVVRYGDLRRALLGALSDRDIVHFGTPVEMIEQIDTGAAVITATGRCRAARAALVAEGGGVLLGRLGFEASVKDYGVYAVVARVSTDRPHRNVAFERFAPAGPIALLPQGDCFAVVWTVTPDVAEHIRAAPETVFLHALQEAFGWRAGHFVAVQGRAAFPLALKRAEPVARGSIVAIGNAAQTLHPIAGQGLNLGLRDAWACVRTLGTAAGAFDAGEIARQRRTDRAATIAFTDGLAELFTTGLPPVAAARAAGLAALDVTPPLRHAFARTLTLGFGR